MSIRSWDKLTNKELEEALSSTRQKDDIQNMNMDSLMSFTNAKVDILFPKFNQMNSKNSWHNSIFEVKDELALAFAKNDLITSSLNKMTTKEKYYTQVNLNNKYIRKSTNSPKNSITKPKSYLYQHTKKYIERPSLTFRESRFLRKDLLKIPNSLSNKNKVNSNNNNKLNELQDIRAITDPDYDEPLDIVINPKIKNKDFVIKSLLPEKKEILKSSKGFIRPINSSRNANETSKISGISLSLNDYKHYGEYFTNLIDNDQKVNMAKQQNQQHQQQHQYAENPKKASLLTQNKLKKLSIEANKTLPKLLFDNNTETTTQTKFQKSKNPIIPPIPLHNLGIINKYHYDNDMKSTISPTSYGKNDLMFYSKLTRQETDSETRPTVYLSTQKTDLIDSGITKGSIELFENKGIQDNSFVDNTTCNNNNNENNNDVNNNDMNTIVNVNGIANVNPIQKLVFSENKSLIATQEKENFPLEIPMKDQVNDDELQQPEKQEQQSLSSSNYHNQHLPHPQSHHHQVEITISPEISSELTEMANIGSITMNNKTPKMEEKLGNQPILLPNLNSYCSTPPIIESLPTSTKVNSDDKRKSGRILKPNAPSKPFSEDIEDNGENKDTIIIPRIMNYHNLIDFKQCIDPDMTDFVIDILPDSEIRKIDSKGLFLKKIEELTNSYDRETIPTTNNNLLPYENDLDNNKNINSTSFLLKYEEETSQIVVDKPVLLKDLAFFTRDHSNSMSKDSTPRNKGGPISSIGSNGGSGGSGIGVSVGTFNNAIGGGFNNAISNGGFSAINTINNGINQVSMKKKMIIINVIPPIDEVDETKNSEIIATQMNEKQVKYEFYLPEVDDDSKEIVADIAVFLSDLDAIEKDSNLLLGIEENISNFSWARSDQYFSKEESTFNFFHYFESMIRKKYPFIIKNYFEKIKSYEHQIMKHTIKHNSNLQIHQHKFSYIHIDYEKTIGITKYEVINEEYRLKEVKTALDSQKIVSNQMSLKQIKGGEEEEKAIAEGLIEDEIEYNYDIKKTILLLDHTLVEPIKLKANHKIMFHKPPIITVIEPDAKMHLIESKSIMIPLQHLNLPEYNLQLINNDHLAERIADIIDYTDGRNYFYLAELVKEEYDYILTGGYEHIINLYDPQYPIKISKSNTKDLEKKFTLNPFKEMVNEHAGISKAESTVSEFKKLDTKDENKLMTMSTLKNNLQRFSKYKFKEIEEKEELSSKDSVNKQMFSRLEKNNSLKNNGNIIQDNKTRRSSRYCSVGIEKREIKELPSPELIKFNTVNLNEFGKTTTSDFDNKNGSLSNTAVETKKPRLNLNSSSFLKIPHHGNTTNSTEDKSTTISLKPLKKNTIDNLDDNKDEEPPKNFMNYLQKMIEKSMKNYFNEKSEHNLSKHSSSNIPSKNLEIDEIYRPKENNIINPVTKKTNGNTNHVRQDLNNFKMDKNSLLMRTHMLSMEKKKKLTMIENIFLAVQENKLSELEELFLHSTSCIVDTRDKNGDTLLHIASQSGFSDIAEFLISKGANIDIQNNEGNTPLHLALGYCHTVIADRLIEAGASQNIKNNKGKKPWDLCNYR